MATHHVTVLDAMDKSHFPSRHSSDWRCRNQVSVAVEAVTAEPSGFYRRCSTVFCRHLNRGGAAASFIFDNMGFSLQRTEKGDGSWLLSLNFLQVVDKVNRWNRTKKKDKSGCGVSVSETTESMLLRVLTLSKEAKYKLSTPLHSIVHCHPKKCEFAKLHGTVHVNGKSFFFFFPIFRL